MGKDCVFEGRGIAPAFFWHAANAVKRVVVPEFRPRVSGFSPPDDTARLRVEDMFEIVGIEPCIEHVMAVGADADVENLVAASREARNRGWVEDAFVAFDGRFD